jgi:hypothetical protein
MNMYSEDDHEDYPWADFFIASSNPYDGWVGGKNSYGIILIKFLISESCSDQHFVRWEDDGTVTHGSKIAEQDTSFFIVLKSMPNLFLATVTMYYNSLCLYL